MRNGSEAPRHNLWSGFFGPKHSGQILGNALIWGSRGGEKRERSLSLKLFPLVRVILGRLVQGPVFLFRLLDTEGTDPWVTQRVTFPVPARSLKRLWERKETDFALKFAWSIFMGANCIEWLLKQLHSSFHIKETTFVLWYSKAATPALERSLLYLWQSGTHKKLFTSFKRFKKNYFCSFLLFIYYYKFIFYSSTVDLQCCGSFRCPAKRFSYI